MTNKIAWKISLPVAAPRNAPTQNPSPEADDRLSPRGRQQAESELSTWLPTKQLALMKEKYLSILAAETSTLKASACHDPALWKAFPNADTVVHAEQLASEFRASLEREEAESMRVRAVCDVLGLDWRSPALPNVEAAEKTLVRYTVAAIELERLAQATEKWVGVSPTLRDAAFLVAISASLRSANLAAMQNILGSREEVSYARTGLETLDKIGAELQSEFSFDPTEHSRAAFGGLARAFASKRAADFLTAAKKLGISLKGPDQAQRAASLLKDYIAAQAALLSPDLQPMTDEFMEALVARARLRQSIQHRAEIMGVDLGLLSPQVADIDLQDFTLYPGPETFEVSSDTRKLIEDNLSVAASGTPLSELSFELSRVAAEIGGCTKRLRRGILLAAEGSNHEDIEEVLRNNPEPMSGQNGYVLRKASDLDALVKHIQWLLDAAMLPLSDEQLLLFLDHARTH